MATAYRVKVGSPSIDYTPSGAVAAGDIVVVGEIVGVAPRAIAASALGALDVEGEFDFPKSTGSASALTLGAKVYWDASGAVVTTTASSHKVAGHVSKAAAAADSTVRIKLARA
jgi:predicted RecA/RadA family phage recombinase